MGNGFLRFHNCAVWSQNVVRGKPAVIVFRKRASKQRLFEEISLVASGRIPVGVFKSNLGILDKLVHRSLNVGCIND